MHLLPDEEKLVEAYYWATLSPDPSTQNGAVLYSRAGYLIGTGYNTFPFGIRHTEERLLNRDKKLMYIEHAERNCLFSAVRNQSKIESSTLFCPWIACHDCCRAIVQMGVARIVGDARLSAGKWMDSIEVGMDILGEAGVKVDFLFEGQPQGLLDLTPIRKSGELFYP